MDITKKPDETYWQGCWGNGCLVHCWWDFKLAQPLWKRVWRFLKNLNGPASCFNNPTPGWELLGSKIFISKRGNHKINAVLLFIAKTKKQSEKITFAVFIHAGMDHIMQEYSALQKKFVICRNMDEPRRDYAKWNKPATEGHILLDLSNGRLRRSWTHWSKIARWLVGAGTKFQLWMNMLWRSDV